MPNPKFPPSSAKVVSTLYLYIRSTSFGVRDNRATQPPTHFINSTEVWELSQKFLEMVEFFFLPRLTLSTLRPLVSEIDLTLKPDKFLTETETESTKEKKIR